MTLVAEAPAQAVPGSTPDRPRRWLLPLLAVLLVLAGIATTLVLMAPGAASFPAVAARGTGAPFVTVPEYGPSGTHILGYEHGTTARLTLTVHNSGPLPLKVTSVDLGGGPAPLLAARGVDGLPLRLRPGGTGEVTVRIALVNCRFFNERELQIYDGVRLGFTSLGRDATRVVPFDRPIHVKSPMLASCPDRKIDRSLNRRGDLL